MNALPIIAVVLSIAGADAPPAGGAVIDTSQIRSAIAAELPGAVDVLVSRASVEQGQICGRFAAAESRDGRLREAARDYFALSTPSLRAGEATLTLGVDALFPNTPCRPIEDEARALARAVGEALSTLVSDAVPTDVQFVSVGNTTSALASGDHIVSGAQYHTLEKIVGTECVIQRFGRYDAEFDPSVREWTHLVVEPPFATEESC